MKQATPLLYAAAGAALIFCLCADTCETSTEFPGFVPENCTDKIDNDGDGLVDCLDSDCEAACQVTVVLNAPGSIINDTLPVSGSVNNASTVSVTVRPSGEADQAVVNGNAWHSVIRKLSASGTYTITVTATGAAGATGMDTATVVKN